MNLDVLRAFFVVVEMGSLNRAAERLRVSQSTLTRQVQALEGEVGGRLLERTSGGVAPTAAGHALIEGMRPVLAQLDGVWQEVRGLARGQSASLRVGYLSSAVDFLNPALAALRSGYPQVKVRLLDLAPGAQIAALRKGEIDVALLGQAGAFLTKEFHTRRLVSLPVVAALAAGHPLAARDGVSMAELRGELFVSANEEDMPGYNRWVEQLCRRARFRPRFTEVSESLGEGLAVVVTEGAVMLQSDHVRHTRSPGVVFVPLSDKGAVWEMFVAWQRGRATAPLRAFLDALPTSVPG
ncbi:LysR family transcriptional regulator [Geminisphaera colitermitum]|uniref:LysR family transcriptional regulator n=1 Tax=Geminisphaera colitermitum TaxID=1148786 RepID=UPI0005BE29D6|nr:LysR family transcriptional regulator [Geminisphaera colitermitum]